MFEARHCPGFPGKNCGFVALGFRTLLLGFGVQVFYGFDLVLGVQAWFAV